jgi:hypothetical protein
MRGHLDTKVLGELRGQQAALQRRSVFAGAL